MFSVCLAPNNTNKNFTTNNIINFTNRTNSTATSAAAAVLEEASSSSSSYNLMTSSNSWWKNVAILVPGVSAFSCSLLANTAIFISICRYRQLRSIVNVCLACIMLSDGIFCLIQCADFVAGILNLSSLSSAVDAYEREGRGGGCGVPHWWCKVNRPVLEVAAYSAIIGHFLVGVNRVSSLYWPTYYQRYASSRLALLLFFLLGPCLTVPIYYGSSLFSSQPIQYGWSQQVFNCYTIWSDTTFWLCDAQITALVIITVFSFGAYGAVFAKLYLLQGGFKQSTQHKTRLALAGFFVVISVMLVFIPSSAIALRYQVVSPFNSESTPLKVWKLWWPHFIRAYVHAWKPIWYFTMNEEYRLACKCLLWCCSGEQFALLLSRHQEAKKDNVNSGQKAAGIVKQQQHNGSGALYRHNNKPSVNVAFVGARSPMMTVAVAPVATLAWTPSSLSLSPRQSYEFPGRGGCGASGYSKIMFNNRSSFMTSSNKNLYA